MFVFILSTYITQVSYALCRGMRHPLARFWKLTCDLSGEGYVLTRGIQ